MCSNNCNCNETDVLYEGGCGNSYRSCNPCHNEYYNDVAVFEDVERLAREAIRRRCREDYCARQFCRCMRNARCGNSSRNNSCGCGCNRGCRQ